jgi:adenosylcobinamide-phosphate synthase
MSFFAVLLALLLEQLKPLPRDGRIRDALVAWVGWTGRNFDAGGAHHAGIVWGVSVLVPSLAAAGLYLVISHYSLLLALVFNVAVLYATLGFRQFSHYYTDIRDALDRGDEDEARRLLGQWRHLDASELPRTEVLRHVIEHALLAAHRHVFGVFFWFVILSALGLGPMGAVLYRMAEFSSRHWAQRTVAPDLPANERLLALSREWFARIDHVPARLTAFGFAVVGNFEEAVAGWRRDAGLWAQPNEGVILASAAGAVGVQLGGGGAQGATVGATVGATPVAGHLGSVVGLVWRSVVLWMLLVALLSLANLLG